jgi:WD40 repeat protein
VVDYVVALSVSYDGGQVAVGTSGGQLHVYETATGRLAFERTAHSGGVLACQFCPRAPLLATGGQDGYARLFDPTGREQAFVSGGAASVAHLAWSPSGELLATASGRTARVWSSEGKPLFELEPAAGMIGAVSWNQRGTQLAVASYGGVHVVDARRGNVMTTLRWNGSFISLAWSHDDSVIAGGTRERSVHFWRLPAGKDSEMSGFVAQPRALCWSPDSKRLATSGRPAISLWSFDKGPEGRRPMLLTAHQALCTVLAFHPTQPWLVSGGDDAAIYVWRPLEASLPLGLGQMEETVTGVAWAPRANAVIAADASGLVQAFLIP